ncbi:MAG: hypothetical protein ACR2NY_00685 [Alphaproteobacteria bacterium]
MVIKLDKKIYGKFFTCQNPFRSFLFQQWFKMIPAYQNQTILEPFAGENNIVNLLRDVGIGNDFNSFDINIPLNNKASDVTIQQQNTLKNFPKNYSIAITNPPYLAKNSATRDKLPYPKIKYDDIYKFALDIMLNHLDFVAAIIPESFITSGLFHHRLYGVISLNYEMFDDTDCPVCLALFMPLRNKHINPKDFVIYWGDKKIGYYEKLSKNIISTHKRSDWRFNDPSGQIGLYAIDTTEGATIRFVRGEEINSKEIKVTNRGITRIGKNDNVDRDDIINRANDVLTIYRKETYDILMTAFRGLRKDGYYRRRLSFYQANQILTHALAQYV